MGDEGRVGSPGAAAATSGPPGRALRTDRLTLTPFAPLHAPLLHRQWNDAQVRRFLFDDQPVDRVAVERQIEASRAAFAEIGERHAALRRGSREGAAEERP